MTWETLLWAGFLSFVFFSVVRSRARYAKKLVRWQSQYDARLISIEGYKKRIADYNQKYEVWGDTAMLTRRLEVEEQLHVCQQELEWLAARLGHKVTK